MDPAAVTYGAEPVGDDGLLELAQAPAPVVLLAGVLMGATIALVSCRLAWGILRHVGR